MLLKYLRSEVIEASGESELETCISLDSDQEKSRLNALIGAFLDNGDVCTAYRIKTIFSCDYQVGIVQFQYIYIQR